MRKYFANVTAGRAVAPGNDIRPGLSGPAALLRSVVVTSSVVAAAEYEGRKQRPHDRDPIQHETGENPAEYGNYGKCAAPNCLDARHSHFSPLSRRLDEPAAAE